MIAPFRWMGSLTMAASLLVLIAAALAWGTLYETQFGTAAVQRFIYHSWWFQGLLGFLALNLATVAMQRWPWQRRHVPFVLAHLGIILTLLGGLLGGWFGVEGQLVVPEGRATSILQLSQNVLVVHQPNPGISRELPTRFETTAWRHEPHALFEVPLKDRTLRLVVDRYYPNAERHETVVETGTTDNPAVRIQLASEDRRDELWLFSRDPERFAVRWGEAHVFFLEETAQWQAPALVDLVPPHSIAVIRTATGDMRAVLRGHAQDQTREVPLTVGLPLTHPTLGYRVEVMAFAPRAAIVEHFTNRDNEVRAEVIHVVGQDGSRVAQAWVPLRGMATLMLGDDSPMVAYQPAQRELPFTVKLLDFRKITYPGIELAAGFESDVELVDPERGVALKRTIKMNHPLTYRGYTLYQSSYIQGPVETTVLSVRNDPGTPLVYAGFLIVILGVIALFVSRNRDVSSFR